VGKTFCLF